jgi:hypothetical protein
MREQIRRWQRRDSRVRGPHRRNRQPADYKQAT